jgi:hypothetical protein
VNIFKITSKDDQDILWLISSLCDFVVYRGSFFVHTELTLSALKRRIRKEGYEVEITVSAPSGDKTSYPEVVAVWALNDKSKAALDYVVNNKEELSEKILNYVIESMTDILKDIEDMKGGKVIG